MRLEEFLLLIRLFIIVNIFIVVYFVVRMIFNKDKNKVQKYDRVFWSDGIYQNSKYYRKNISFTKKIDLIILKSNIQRFIPWASRKAVIYISSALGMIAFLLSYKYLNNIITSFVMFGVFGFIPIYSLELLSSYNSSKIERNFLYFLNILLNFAQLKDDVFYAFEKSIGYIEEPLNGYCKTFVEEVKRGLPVEEALDNFKDKLDNEKFKMFLKNAQLTVKFGGSFVKLTASNLEIMKQLDIEKSRRRSETSLGKTLIYIMMAINIVLGVYMFNLYPDTYSAIKTDFYGQVVVLINTVNLFIVFYLSLRLQKLEY